MLRERAISPALPRLFRTSASGSLARGGAAVNVPEPVASTETCIAPLPSQPAMSIRIAPPAEMLTLLLAKICDPVSSILAMTSAPPSRPDPPSCRSPLAGSMRMLSSPSTPSVASVTRVAAPSCSVAILKMGGARPASPPEAKDMSAPPSVISRRLPLFRSEVNPSSTMFAPAPVRCRLLRARSNPGRGSIIASKEISAGN